MHRGSFWLLTAMPNGQRCWLSRTSAKLDPDVLGCQSEQHEDTTVFREHCRDAEAGQDVCVCVCALRCSSHSDGAWSARQLHFESHYGVLFVFYGCGGRGERGERGDLGDLGDLGERGEGGEGGTRGDGGGEEGRGGEREERRRTDEGEGRSEEAGGGVRQAVRWWWSEEAGEREFRGLGAVLCMSGADLQRR